MRENSLVRPGPQAPESGNGEQQTGPRLGPLYANPADAYPGEVVHASEVLLEPRGGGRLLYGGALLISAIWLGLCLAYIHSVIGWGNLLSLQPYEIGGLAGPTLLPLTFVWLFVAFVDRGSDTAEQARQLRALVLQLAQPSAETDARMLEASQALQRQAEAVEASTSAAAARAEAVVQALRQQAERLQALADTAAGQAGATVDRLGREMQEITAAFDGAGDQAARIEETLRRGGETLLRAGETSADHGAEAARRRGGGAAAYAS